MTKNTNALEFITTELVSADHAAADKNAIENRNAAEIRRARQFARDKALQDEADSRYRMQRLVACMSKNNCEGDLARLSTDLTVSAQSYLKLALKQHRSMGANRRAA